MDKNVTATIFNIQRYSVHDGSGIRSLIFIKGCPLRCRWCANPESHFEFPQLSYVPAKCSGDSKCTRHACIDACPYKAVFIAESGKAAIDWSKCRSCGNCVKACLWKAMSIKGEQMTVEDVMELIVRDRDYFDMSGGGVTVGGGEPMTQPVFVANLLNACKQENINTAIETSAHVKWDNIKMTLPFVDTVLCDIKHMDPIMHKKYTLQDNSLILENIRKLIEEKGEAVIVRTPVIPGFNDTCESIEAIADYVKACGGSKMELLPYHRLGNSKYAQIGLRYLLGELEVPDDEKINDLRTIITKAGIKDMHGML